MNQTSTPPQTKAYLGRWLLGACLALVLVIMVCETIGWPFLRQPLQQLMQAQLQRQVRIMQPFRLQLLGGIHLQAGGLNIAAPEGFDAPYFVSASGLDLSLRYRDLWSLKPADPYRVQAIRADKLHAYLIRHANRQASWNFAQDDNTPPRPFPLIEQLAVNQGDARINDAVTDAQLTLSFFTEEGSREATPESRVTLQGRFKQLPVRGALVTPGFLPVVMQGKDSPPVNSRGWLNYGALRASFHGAIYDVFGRQQVKGEVDVRGPSLAALGDLLDLTLPRTAAFRVHAGIEKGLDRWQVNLHEAKIGRSQLSGQFVYDLAPETPMLSGQLQGALLMLADLAPAFGASEKPGMDTHPGKLFPDEPLDFATYGRMNADIDVKLDAVDLGNAFRQRIAPLKLRLSLQKHKLSLADLEASTAQGTLTGSLAIDAHDALNTDLNPPPAPDWDIQLAVKDIRLEQWLKVTATKNNAKADEKGRPHAESSAPAYISGKLEGKAKLQGQGRSTAALLQSLQGQLALRVRDGAVSHLLIEAAGLDIAQTVGVLIQGDQSLPMQCAVMGWRAKQGVLTPDAALIDTAVTTVHVLGNVDLGQEQLNLQLQARPKNFSPLTVRAPILVTGSFVAPQVKVSPGPIAARVVGGVLLALINPFAAILPFLDPGSAAEASDQGCQQTLQQLKARGHTAAKHSGG